MAASRTSTVVIESASKETCLQLPSGNSRLPIVKELGDDSKSVKQEVVKANTGDARIEETAIEDGIAIANKAAVGYGRVSIFNTSYGVGGSAGGDGISVADVDIATGGGKLTVGKRVVKGGIKIGYPPAPEPAPAP